MFSDLVFVTDTTLISSLGGTATQCHGYMNFGFLST